MTQIINFEDVKKVSQDQIINITEKEDAEELVDSLCFANTSHVIMSLLQTFESYQSLGEKDLTFDDSLAIVKDYYGIEETRISRKYDH